MPAAGLPVRDDPVIDEWVEQGIRFTPGSPQPVENGFVATLTRVAAVTLDVGRMGLDPARELRATITGDGRTELRLKGSWSGTVEVVAGEAAEVVEPVGDVLTVARDFGGAQTVVIRPS